MAAFTIKSFGGVSPKTPPRYLQDTQAQTAVNCPVFSGPLVPLADVTATAIATLTNPGDTLKTIYRFGQDLDNDERYWFAWDREVDVCRGQIAGDPVEWTFFTGDDIPKATYNSLALSSAPFPASNIPLGVPNPTAPLDATPDAQFDNTQEFAAELTLDAVALANLTTNGCEISLDGGTLFTTISLSALPENSRATYVAAQINAAGMALTATVDTLQVVIRTTALGENASIIFRGIQAVSSRDNTTGTFTYTNGFDKTNTAAGLQDPLYFVTADQWGVIGANLPTGKTTRVRVSASQPANSKLTDLVNVTRATPFASATEFANFITANWLNASRTLSVTVVGSTVVLRPNNTNYGKTIGGAYSGRIFFIVDKLDANEKTIAKESAGNVSAAAYSYVFLTRTEFDSFIKGKYSSLTVNGVETITKINDTQTLFFTMPSGVYAEAITNDDSAVMLRTTATIGSSIRLRAGTYPSTSTNTYFTLSANGSENEASVAETRVYTYTWVSKVAEREFESGPAAPSLSVDVFDGQSVLLSKFQQASLVNGVYYVDKIYQVNARRIYRAVNGVYLFVDEIPVNQTEYTDTKAPDDLSEEMSVANWSPPPNTLQGLINLPNGMMAGFVSRDVYFCQPFYPHAWPEDYVQTLDYPVVGLGRMDTTLVVLTTGVPYFIQGSHPDSMVVVKSDIQQACASKRSIVSISGRVFFASPDGLVMLSTGGSQVITENMFTRAQWQQLNPTSIHAYQHDMKYVAFYDTGTVQGGFIYDMISSQFIFHDVYATAGYNDLQRDQLFLTFDDKSIRRWLDGPVLDYVWRSKVFTMPQVMGFTCAQIEAETYPLTVKFYCDDLATPYYTLSVPSRAPFRLPVKVGRDWQLQLEGTSQVFSAVVAQSMEELASA